MAEPKILSLLTIQNSVIITLLLRSFQNPELKDTIMVSKEELSIHVLEENLLRGLSYFFMSCD